jgi:hypothetical protein
MAVFIRKTSQRKQWLATSSLQRRLPHNLFKSDFQIQPSPKNKVKYSTLLYSAVNSFSYSWHFTNYTYYSTTCQTQQTRTSLTNKKNHRASSVLVRGRKSSYCAFEHSPTQLSCAALYLSPMCSIKAIACWLKKLLQILWKIRQWQAPIVVVVVLLHLKGHFFGLWSNPVARGTGSLQFGLTIRHF